MTRLMCASLLGLVVLLALGAGLAAAAGQQPPAPPPATAPSTPDVSLDAQRAYLTLQARGAGWVQAIRALQKELDATNAEIARLVDEVQKAQPGYDVTDGPDGRLVYRKKPDAKAPEKKDETQN